MANVDSDSQHSSIPLADHDQAKARSQARQQLEDAISGSNEVLASATTVLSIFPDTMIIDREKVTIVKRMFFRTANIMSIRIEDVLNATSTVGPFLGAVSVTSRVMNDEQIANIGKFWRSDAKRLKRVMQGYVIALQKNIDCASLNNHELAVMLEKLGADNHLEV